jgi:hypothetical protein
VSRLGMILVEGYEDRDFFGALLRSRFAANVLLPDAFAARVDRQPLNASHSFAIGAATIAVTPAKGKASVRSVLKTALKAGGWDRILVCVDADVEHDDVPEFLSGWLPNSTLAVEPIDTTPPKSWKVNGVPVREVFWRVEGAAALAFPRQQTLERLIAAVVESTHPDRLRDVQQWLQGEARAAASVKAHHLARVAKWNAEDAGAIFQRLWADPVFGYALVHQLQKSGAWPAIEEFVTQLREPT